MMRYFGRQSSRQLKGRTATKCAALRRWRIIRDASDEGLTMEEAARLAGLKISSVKTVLYQRTGHTTWPIEKTEEEPNAR